MAALLSSLKRTAKKSAVVSSVGYIATNYLTGLRFRLGRIETTSGMAHAGRSTAESVAYIERVFADYKRYSGVARFSGRVAEIGPGDNGGVGLLFLADSCDSVDLVDRFYSLRNANRNEEIYRNLIAKHPRLAELHVAAGYDDTAFKGLARRYGESASAEEYFTENRGYRFIVSRAVMEHVYDPVLAMRRMAAALEPGGMLLHKVDLRDHALFSAHAHELKFLEFPDWFYRRMTHNSGRPNRVLIHAYRSVLRETLPDHEILVTRLVGFGDIEPHQRYEDIDPKSRETSLNYVRSVRHRFAASFDDVSSEDLSVAGIFIVARKA